MVQAIKIVQCALRMSNALMHLLTLQSEQV